MEASLAQSKTAIGKLDTVLLVIVAIIIVFVGFHVYEVDTEEFMAISISLWAGTLFAIGGTIKNLVESIMFLFFVHPFDVGDMLIIDGKKYIVREFGLMSTTLARTSGEEVFVSNAILATKVNKLFKLVGY